MNNHKNFWDFYSHIYDEKKRDFDINFRNINYEILKRYLGNKREIIEIGCGTGTDTVFMNQYVNKIIAIDLSLGMLKKAREKIKGKRVFFINLRAENIDAIKREFEGAYSSFGVLNCIENLNTFFYKMSKILKRKGIFVFSVINRLYFFDLIYFLTKRYNFFLKRVKGYGRITLNGKEYDAIARYYSYKDIIRFSRDYFYIRKIYALPFIVPPSYLRPHVKLKRKLYNFVFKIEKRVYDKFPFNILGEQTIYVLEKK